MGTSVQIVMDCARPGKLAEFWAEALHYRLQDPPEGFESWSAFLAAQAIPEAEWDSASAIVDPEGAGPRVFFQRVPEPKVAKNRVHLDMHVSGPRGTPLAERRARVDAEVVRLKGLGASDARGAMERGDEYWVRMNDPEGNEFCVQ